MSNALPTAYSTRAAIALRTVAARAILTAVAFVVLSISARAQSLMPDGRARKLIEHFHMQKVPQEGVWFTLSYSSSDTLDGENLPARYAGRPRLAGNAIVALETPVDFSALHRLQTDEVWHFYEGSPIDMLLLYPDGHGQRLTLGPDIFAGQLRQFTVPRGVWQGSMPRGRLSGAYSLFADQLSPGFDYADFEIGYRDKLQLEYPAFARDIERLTRSEFAVTRSGTTAGENSVAQARTSGTQPARGDVFSEADIAAVIASPGVVFKELVGHASPLAPTPRFSVAQFTLSPGRSSGTSFNHFSQEVFVVTRGSGRVRMQSNATEVHVGSTVFIPPMQQHSIEAGANDTLEFLAISAPAFTPEDYVLVAP